MDELIKETRWTRVYERDDGSKSIRSKFITDGLSIASAELKDLWSQWDEGERVEFAQAFSVKDGVSPDDCESLEFMMKNASDMVASAVALKSAMCLDGGAAFDLIAARLGDANNVPKSNFFQALGKLGDQRGVAVLEAFRVSLAGEVASETVAIDVVVDYLSCCTALAMLTGNSAYMRYVEPYLDDNRESIRWVARVMIENRLKQT
jgi:hypothetical protein